VKPVEFRRAASADVSDAFDWYEQERPGLGGEFLQELDRTIERIRSGPQQYQIKYRVLRSAKLRRFPYRVFYREADDHVVIVGCIHGHRSPRVWQRRKWSIGGGTVPRRLTSGWSRRAVIPVQTARTRPTRNPLGMDYDL
jgi:toxin ParE1/3/4